MSKDYVSIIDVKDHVGEEVTIGAWVANKSGKGKIAFLQLRDGTAFFQAVAFKPNFIEKFGEEEGTEKFNIKHLNQETSILITGIVKEDSRSKFGYELDVTDLEIVGHSEDYPITPKEHGTDFLMDHRHLWLRSRKQMAIMQVRNAIIYATYEFFDKNGFIKFDSPILSGNAAEDSTELFETDYFGTPAYLSQSGQLYLEAGAMALGRVFDFGPVFRAEKSKTRRHLIEFWMIEPEMAFADLDDNMALAESMLKYIIQYVLENAPEEMAFFNSFVDKGLLDRLKHVLNSEFGHVTYTEAVEILEKVNDKFEYKVFWGCDLQTEHERYLTEQVYKRPVFVTDYPKEIKAFYMKQNDDNKTVAAMDCLVPGIGEIIGGSQREDSYDKLKARMAELDLNEEDYDFYLDLRKYGSTRHSGFGLGFERCVMYLTGMQNIRDVLPFPRTVNNCEL